jgi:hypothetical protein
MRAIDASDRIRPLDVHPYDRHSLALKPTAHLHYGYRIKDGCL